MKSQFFSAVVTFLLAFGMLTTVSASQPLMVTDVQVVMTQKKIWFVADESPVKCMRVQMVNEQGAVVMQKQFSSKTAEWSLDVQELSAGTYQLFVDDIPVKLYVKECPRA